MQPTVAWIFFLHHTWFYYTLISVTKSGSSSDPFVGPTLVLNKQQIIKSNSGSTRRLNVSQNVFLFGGELSADTENLVLIYQRAATKFVKIFPVLASISQEASQQIDSGYKLYVRGNTPKSRSSQIIVTCQRCAPRFTIVLSETLGVSLLPLSGLGFQILHSSKVCEGTPLKVGKVFQNMKYKIRRYVKARCRPARYFEMLNPKFIASFHSSADLTLMSKWEVLSNLPPKTALSSQLLFHQLAQFASSFAAIFQFSARSADSASRYFPIMLFSLPTWCHPSTFHFENRFWTKLVMQR